MGIEKLRDEYIKKVLEADNSESILDDIIKHAQWFGDEASRCEKRIDELKKSNIDDIIKQELIKTKKDSISNLDKKREEIKEIKDKCTHLRDMIKKYNKSTKEYKEEVDNIIKNSRFPNENGIKKKLNQGTIYDLIPKFSKKTLGLDDEKYSEVCEMLEESGRLGKEITMVNVHHNKYSIIPTKENIYSGHFTKKETEEFFDITNLLLSQGELLGYIISKFPKKARSIIKYKKIFEKTKPTLKDIFEEITKNRIELCKYIETRDDYNLIISDFNGKVAAAQKLVSELKNSKCKFYNSIKNNSFFSNKELYEKCKWLEKIDIRFGDVSATKNKNEQNTENKHSTELGVNNADMVKAEKEFESLYKKIK